MEWVEITAKTVEEAKERALDELGIGHDEAEFVVVEEPRRGLFRQTRGDARVRARVAPRTPRAKTDRRTRRARSSGGSEGSDELTTSSADASTKPAANDGGKAKPSKARSAAPKAAKSKTGNAKSGNAKSAGAGTTKSTKSKKEVDTTMTMTLDEQTAATEIFLAGLLDAFGSEGKIATERTDDANAQVNIEGADLGLLIGPRGQTLNAIQDLARVTLQKQAAGSWEGHVHVDVNGYRAKRSAALVAFAEKVAIEVRESGVAKALEPMSASDRKMVHDAVNEIDGVSTSSEGVAPRRWVKIIPDEA